MSCGARWAAVTAVLASLWLASAAHAQTFFYTEVAKDGRIYVFAISSRHEAFTKSNGTDIGTVIERPGYDLCAGGFDGLYSLGADQTSERPRWRCQLAHRGSQGGSGRVHRYRL